MISIRKTYGNRIKNSFIGAVMGILLFLGSFALLSWNERDAVRQTGAVTELDKVAMTDVAVDAVDQGNEGKLVHMATEAQTDQELEYPTFGIRENAIRLRWDASIYQWVEDRREQDDRTAYEYDKQWVDQPINSDRFADTSYSNKGSQKHFQDGRVQAEDVSFGAFRLSKSLISQIGNERPHRLPESIAMDVRPQGSVSDGVFYTSDAATPQIGDERVEVYIVGPRHDVTIMARQKDDSFAPYETSVGIAKEILYAGLLSKQEVIAKQRTEVAIRRWLFRGLGFGCMWIGLAMFLSPLRAVLSFIPFAGRLVGGAIGLATFLISLALSAIVIAIAWFVVRPVLSFILVAIALVCLFFLFRKPAADFDRDARSAGPPPLPTAP